MPLYPSSDPRRPRRMGLASLALLGAVCVLPAQALVLMRQQTPPPPPPSPVEDTAPPVDRRPLSNPAIVPSRGGRHTSDPSSLDRFRNGVSHSMESVSNGLHRSLNTVTHQVAEIPKTVADAFTPSFTRLDHEISLQETLDRLGYTVNVPTRYDGHALLQWSQFDSGGGSSYRTSTQSDAVSSDWFQCSGQVTLKTLGQQGALAPKTNIGLAGDNGRETLMNPAGDNNGLWISREGEHTATFHGAGLMRPFEEKRDTGGSFGGDAVFFSTVASNPDGSDRLLLLPARTGGTWVDEGNDTGHWEGGQDTGAYLMCWEDWTDNDYQDLVILAEGVQPTDR